MNGSTAESLPEKRPLAIKDPRSWLLFFKNQFIQDTVYLQLGAFITIGTYLLTSMVLARSLGPVELGRYDLATKFYDLCFFIANMGLINVTVVRYSHAVGSRDRDGKVLALAAFLKIYLLMAVAIVVLGFFLCPFVGVFFYSDQRVGYFGWALCTMGLIEIMRVMARAILLGARQMRDAACLDSAIALTRLLVLVMAIAGGFELEGVIFGSVLHAALSSLVGFRFYFLLRREGEALAPPGLKEVIAAMPRATLRQFFSMGFFIALNKNMVQIVLALGTFFIADTSFHDAGLLRIAVILVWGLQLMLSGINQN
ncbi:MAG: oligosaccharide flippase family protein, partial [Planctomycetota bacterium]